MSTPTNTDEVFTNPESVPTPEQEAPSMRFVDIHIYDVSPEDATQTLDRPLTEGEEAYQPKEWQEQQTEPRKTHTKRYPSPLFLVLVALFILLLITGGLTYFYLFTPSVTVTIVPSSAQVQTTSTITIVAQAPDAMNNQIEGRSLPVLTMSQSQTIATTGRTELVAQSGHGSITFYNAATYPQTIVAGTLLTGKDGIQVATNQSVTVPAVNYPTLGAATVSAHAVQTGPESNIEAGDIYGPCCVQNISAVNGGFTGGENAQTYQSVAGQDIDTATTNLKRSLLQSVQIALTAQVQSGETLLTPLSCETHSSTDHQVGAKATLVQVTVNESCTGIAYDTQAFQQQITQAQTQAADRELRAHDQLSGVQATVQNVVPGSSPGTYTLTVQSNGMWVYHFSQAELNHLAMSIAGKGKGQATTLLLHTRGVQTVSLQFAPGITTIPTDPSHIHMLFLMG